jgi:hypothetical protein
MTPEDIAKNIAKDAQENLDGLAVAQDVLMVAQINDSSDSGARNSFRSAATS